MQRFLREHWWRVLVLAVVGIIAIGAVTTLVREATSQSGSGTRLVGWGDNDMGQLGTGHLNYSSGSLVASKSRVKLTNLDVTAVYAGLRHSFALTSNGKVYAWGNNEYGQLGLGSRGGRHVSPKQIKGLPKIVMVATKQDHTLALDEDGHVWSWGLNMSGQLGDGTNTDRSKPYKVPNLDKVAFVATGYRSSTVIKDDGSVWQWGGNCNLAKRDKSLASYVSQLTVSGYTDGTGGTIEHITPEDDCLNERYLNIKSYIPEKVADLPAIQSLSVGFGHTLAVAKNGDLWTWGCNLYGQIGDGSELNEEVNLTPQKITGIGKVTMVAAGFRHSLAIDAKGRLWSWGHNYFGELGDGTVNEVKNTVIPTLVPSLTNVQQISAGHDYSLAISDGKLYGWGQASFAQLGKQSDVAIGTPARLQQLRRTSQVAAGGAHVLAIFGRSSR